jgi:arabinose-5-phosphate isomerase
MNLEFSDEGLVDLGRQALSIEIEGLRAQVPRLGPQFARACRICLDCRGRIVVTGMGKSGHIGGKIAATLASTGTPAFFVHPGEASHGDLGMITRQDLVLAISNSGETAEILTILPLIKRLGAPLVAMTGKPGSTMAQIADVHLDVSVSQEACPLNLAPTASTTATLAMGDALAVALLEARGFTPEDFALSHPGGTLGRRLLLKIADLMHTGERIPRVAPDATVAAALLEMSRKGLGMTAVADAAGLALGVFTDGDLRRVFDLGIDLRQVPIAEVMTRGGKSIGAGRLAAEAVHLMDLYKITALMVLDDDRRLQGVIHMHDLLRAGVV